LSDNIALLPPPKILKVADRELKMPYALLMDVCRMLPDPASAMQLVMSDPITQDYVVRRMLTPLEKPVMSVDDLILPGEVELDIDEVEALLTWVVQHVLYFFAKRTLGLRTVGEQFKLALPNLSSSGSEA